MRSALLAFVVGVWLLQQQAHLPDLLWGALLLPAAATAWRLRRHVFLAKSLLILCAFAAGFFWAALLAHHRLSDALPPQWEGRDIELVGVVADLPKPQ